MGDRPHFEAAFQKAVRSLSFGKKTLLWEDHKWNLGTDINTYPLEPPICGSGR